MMAPAGPAAGTKSILTGRLAGDGRLEVWSNGSGLDGQPEMYLDNPNHHEENANYTQIGSFAPFGGGVPRRPPAPPSARTCSRPD